MILCCGEALIDMLPRKTSDGDDAFLPCPGGAVFNTAIALGRLGAPSGYLGGLSSDLFGAQLQHALKESGVDASLSVVSKRPTTLAFVRLVDGQASYAFYDENTAGRMLAPDDLPALPTDIKALFFGGISLATEPCASAYEALLIREGSRRLVMLDPNIRPGFITDEAVFRARIMGMMAGADMVKLSDEDLHWLAGPGDLVGLAQGLLGDRTKVVFLTEGARGARAITADFILAHPAPAANVVDTVGAGDTFNAGVLSALQDQDALAAERLTQDALQAALSKGTAAAAITVSRAGANPPWAREL